MTVSERKRLVLTEADKRSQLWVDLMVHWESKIEGLRLQNEGEKSEIETANLRGRIAELRANLNLNKDQPKIDI